MTPLNIERGIATPSARTADEWWMALGPAAITAGVLAVALVAYAVRARRFGRFHDEEMDQRGIGGLTSRTVRHFFAWLMRPLWRGLVAAEVPPNAITTLALGFAIGAGIGAAVGRFAIAGWLFLTAGALDFLDGRVAREGGRATKAGAVLDSVVDRYCESALLVGLAWYYRGSTALVAALLALTGSSFVPYVRARGEAIGVVMKEVGFMQRPERVAVLGFGVALAPVPEALLFPHAVRPTYHLTIFVLWLLAATSHLTALHRLSFLLRALGGKAASAFGSLVAAPRVVVTSVVATGIDYLFARELFSAYGLSPAMATGIGAIVGGVIAFTLSRNWAFGGMRGSLHRQASSYAFVSGTSAALNAGTVALLFLIPGTDFPIGWVIARALSFLTWNLPILHGSVFPPPEPRIASAAAITARLAMPRVGSSPKVAT